MPIHQSILDQLDQNTPALDALVFDGANLLESQRLDNQDILALCQAARANAHLKRLTIRHQFITDVSLQHLAALRHLEVLDISYNDLISGDLTLLSQLARLKSLNLSGLTTISIESLRRICALPDLETLMLDDALLLNEEALVLRSGRFKTLSVKNHQLDNEGIGALLSNPALCHLAIGLHDDDQDAGLYLNLDIAHDIRNHPSLTSLDMSGYVMSPVVFDLICENSRLEVLHIKNCRFSARTLDKALNIKSLQYLNALDNEVDDRVCAECHSTPGITGNRLRYNGY